MSFLENLKRSFKRRKRNVKYFFQWLFNEKLHGVDFTMRNYKVRGTKKYIENDYHGYAKTPEEVINNMLDSMNITSEDCFIDVGCGKGVTLKEAAKRDFKRVAGIELDPGIYEITKNNFKRLGMQDRVEVFNCNAVDFDRYNEFNVFYFFNPFGGEARKMVMEKIFQAIRNRTEQNRTEQNRFGFGFSTMGAQEASQWNIISGAAVYLNS